MYTRADAHGSRVESAIQTFSFFLSSSDFACTYETFGVVTTRIDDAFTILGHEFHTYIYICMNFPTLYGHLSCNRIGRCYVFVNPERRKRVTQLLSYDRYPCIVVPTTTRMSPTTTVIMFKTISFEHQFQTFDIFL